MKQSVQVRRLSPRMKGIATVLVSAVLWGITGNVVQFLFQEKGISPEWLVSVRLLTAGAVLLGCEALAGGSKRIWSVWRSRGDWLQMIFFGIVCTFGVQYTYFIAIHAGNAATATVLQYLAPVMIVCYVAAVSRKMPDWRGGTAIFLAVLGAFLIVTGGNIHTLSISAAALAWGVAAAFTLAIYTVFPRKLLHRWGAALTVGWGMMVGGVFFSLICPPWTFVGEWSPVSALSMAFVILFGTVIAFYGYLDSIKYISPAEASIIATIEPLAAVAVSVWWLKTPFGAAEWIGTFCIIAAILILSLRRVNEI